MPTPNISALNHAYLSVLLNNPTEAEYQAALHAYLTSPLRTVPCTCYCTACKGDVYQSIEDRLK